MTQPSNDFASSHSSAQSDQTLPQSIQVTDEIPIPDSETTASKTIDKKDSSKPVFWKDLVKHATQKAKAVTGTAQNLVQSTTETTVQTTKKMSAVAQDFVQTAADTAADKAITVTQTGKAIAQSTTKTSKTVASSIGSGISSVGSGLGEEASQAGQAIAHRVSETQRGGKAIATSIGQGIGAGASQAQTMMVNTVSHATSNAGKAVEWIHDRTHFQHLTRAIKVDWLVGIIDNVNIDSVETRIQELKQKHPTATPYQLAGRIMTKKSLLVGGSGLASSMLPGAAAAMVAFDLATTTAIQAEMGYEIAAAYGLDVQDSARKGEILAIFGLALGSSQALKTGFQYLARNIPVAGAMVGASTNAVALYAVGHAACQFYETKLNEKTSEVLDESPSTLLPEANDADSVEPNLADVETQQQKYFEEAIAQQILMDQVFAHILKAGNPDKDWPQLMPILEDLHFNPASIQLIAQYLDNPSDFDSLIGQINPEFAIPLVAQCQKLVNADGRQTYEEKQLLTKMIEAFGIAELQNN
ncbi:MAG: hypothetical protein AAGD25_32905 [Cyanobacteria bacterium P01_F01_bin.150]